MFIYKITNSVNGKIYIGQDSNNSSKHTRWKYHKYNYINENLKTHLYNSMRKYGIENFEYSIIVDYSDELNRLSYFHREILNYEEIKYIEEYNSYNCGYNMTLGGNNSTILSYDRFDIEISNKLKNIAKGTALKNNKIRWCEENKEKSLKSLKWHTESSNKKRSKTLGIMWNNMDHEIKVERFKKMSMTIKSQSIDKKLKRVSNFKQPIYEYTFISPSNNITVTTDIITFCKNNNLSPSAMRAICRGLYSHHKKWTCSRKEI